ncbi:hypothetical protein [Spartinivicinus marinus]|uniref:hypothetical protein n=1 Tax=Spartinivicinus marinus TaxID=2994442 RepID=UPI0022531E3D|nr:hypothetical protein [Spartinivicinus marinus]MCX4025027.1 hypothetical protein [Spartinivicinus marinus]
MSVPTLEAVASTFKTWRTNRTHGRRKIPAELRQQAVALLNDYPVSLVINTLGLSHSALKRWQQPPDEAKSADTPFITLPEPTQASSSLCVTLCLANDTQLVIQGELSSEQLGVIVRELQPGKRGER